ncbi:MAG: hypothetical protein VX899_15665 [Myxococcota bacterium]|nr:hypothetical protein [Myxococcota bacterium]
MRLPAFLRPRRKLPSGPAPAASSALGVLPELPAFDWEDRVDPRAGLRGGDALATALDSDETHDAVLSALEPLLSPGPEAFEHPTDTAARLFCLIGVLGARDLSPATRARVSAEVQRSADWLITNLAPAGPRRVMQCAALVLAGLGLPGLQGAGRWWSYGLSQLGRDFPAVLHPDGGPRDGSAALLLRQLQFLWPVVQVCEGAGVVLPPELLPALGRASLVLRDIGAGGPLPPLGEDPYEPLLGADTAWPLAQALARSWEDPVGPPGQSKDWELRPLRETGWMVLHAKLRGKVSRAVVDLHSGQVTWDLDGQPVLEGEARGCMSRPADWRAEWKVARVDGRCVTVIFTETGRDGEWTRELRAEGGRLIVTDRIEGASLRARFLMGEGMVLEKGDKPGQWTASGPLKLRIALDTEQATWVGEDRLLAGNLGATKHRSRFEL